MRSDRYAAGWCSYRDQTNESHALAEHLSRLLNARSGIPLRVLDIGAGDGVLLKRIAELSPKRIFSATAIEPNRYLFQKLVSNTGAMENVDTCMRRVRDVPTALFSGKNIGICSHAIYGMTWFETDLLLRSMDAGSSVFIILDDPRSIFSTIWSRTAPSYSAKVRSFFERLKLRKEFVRISYISAELRFPLTAYDGSHGELLSFLAYKDELTPSEREWVKACLDRFAGPDGSVEVLSACFEMAC